MSSVILGTAGHIDHGKTALVRALTGVDTDRLPEEKARGITIDLGFAELPAEADGPGLGVVDVPGHEDFVRTMVAGATGMDVVLLVIAADEGVMPQTREHLDIVRLLDVPTMVVALTKADLVDEDWLALVREDVAELLAGTRYATSAVVVTSTRDGRGLDALRSALRAATLGSRRRSEDDLGRLPLDRVFTVQGTGTVVTGTLWSGTLAVGARVRLMPGGAEARVRALQVHGRDVSSAHAGERTAVALAGIGRDEVERGAVLVTAASWHPTWMLTARASVLPGAPGPLAHGQRVRVHLGTAEVLARCAVLDGREVAPGREGWVQFRLESPTVARARDRLVLRSYSPVTTVGGGEVAEPRPPKRRHLDAAVARSLARVLDGSAHDAARAALELAGWSGLAADQLPLATGRPPAALDEVRDALAADGVLAARDVHVAPAVAEDAAGRIRAAVALGHAEEPLRAAVPLERLRAALPEWSAPGLADAVMARLRERGEIELAEGGARAPDFTPTPTPDQEQACAALLEAYRRAGLAAPFVDDLPAPLRGRPDLSQLLRFLEARGEIRTVDAGLFLDAAVLEAAARDVARLLGGRTALGPADFREILDVPRRQLMPILAYLDGVGVTVRRGPVRDVPTSSR